ncbi:MAG TPA: cyclic nucleotide-binding domain-containing protein [Verrucomicrobia bacterium]|nr:cyclic nucleotide-binding domain-containing protein [Verrucomicrobiota bacterium]
MSLTIRKATPADTQNWLQLLKEVLGSDPAAAQAYDLHRVSGQILGPGVQEVWLAEVDGRINASVSFLQPDAPSANPVANLGRYLALPESYTNGSAEALMSGVNEICAQRKHMAVTRVPGSDTAQQRLLEKLGYGCVGFQPLKHLCAARENVLLYVRRSSSDGVARYSLSQSLPEVAELGAVALGNLGLDGPERARDGLTGYPLCAELDIREADLAEFEQARLDAQEFHPPLEIFGQFNLGWGLLRVAADTPRKALLGRREGRVTAGLTYYLDELDKCVRWVDAFATDDLSMGAVMRRAVELAQGSFGAVYVEADLLATAPRALKTAEQLGFMPVAYLPGFYNWDGCGIDVVKMVKLNAGYTVEHSTLTPHARTVVDVVHRNFQDQKSGAAIIALLRTLPVFNGLGDGELGKIARLFSQKLYRPGETVFSKGELSHEACVVMRGQVDIYLEANGKPIASVGNGAIVGEQAFLDGAARNAFAIAAQPSILLIIQRPAFQRLIQSEPHLGMAIMRNIAIDVSNKLRQADAMMKR